MARENRVGPPRPMSMDKAKISPTLIPPGYKPPPPEGGWGYMPGFGWGYFPGFGGKPNPLPPLPERPDPPPDGGGETPPPGESEYVTLFEDRFDSNKLDQSKWWTRYIFPGPDGPGTLDYLNDEWERYRETGNHILGAGSGIGLNSTPHNGEFWPSGMLRSKQLFDLASGDDFYFECKGKVPRGKGTWDAFWLSADARDPNDVMTVMWPPEIDIMEIVNNGQDDTTTMLGARCQVHDWNNNPQKYQITEAVQDYNSQWSVWYAPFDFADDYHLFGLHYKRPNYTIYCDRNMIVSGVYDWVWDDGSPAPPAHILCNLAIGGAWAGRYGIDESQFPQALDVEYISVIAKKAMQLPQSVIGKDYEVT